MNKNSVTNIVALIITIIGWYFDQDIIFNIGIFAFSCALTNSIAIHMLFEKVPFFYGSGVIASRFEQFKSGIHDLVMSQFFSKENVERFLSQKNEHDKAVFDFSPVIEKTDLSPAFDSLIKVVEQSSFGGMLGLFGGTAALMPLKEPFISHLKSSLVEVAGSSDFNQLVQEQLGHKDQFSTIQVQIERIVKQRLDELTPELVKDIIQNMIREHLGWLVVWGGVFGGLIGLITALIK